MKRAFVTLDHEGLTGRGRLARSEQLKREERPEGIGAPAGVRGLEKLERGTEPISIDDGWSAPRIRRHEHVRGL